MHFHQNAYPYPSFSVQKSIRNQRMTMSVGMRYKRADLIRAILAIWYQVLRNLYRFLGLWGWDKSTKRLKITQPPAFQSPSVLHPIIIIQNSWELIHSKQRGIWLWLWWFDRSNCSGIYIGFKSILDWGHQTFRHQCLLESCMTNLQKNCLKLYFKQSFTGNVRNGPLLPEICTGAVIFIFLSTARGLDMGSLQQNRNRKSPSPSL